MKTTAEILLYLKAIRFEPGTHYTRGSDRPVKNEGEWLAREIHHNENHSGYWDECTQHTCLRAKLERDRAAAIEASLNSWQDFFDRETLNEEPGSPVTQIRKMVHGNRLAATRKALGR